MEQVTINKELCNQDGICIRECPARVLIMDEQEEFPVPIPEFKEYCIRCGHCVAVCPKGALRLDWLEPENCPSINKSLVVTPEQAEQFLMGRRSIRTFKDKTVSREILEKLLEVACAAPSAKNKQPWYWTVVQDPKEVQKLAGLVVEWMEEFLVTSPEDERAIGYRRVVDAWKAGIDRVCRQAPHLIIVHAESDWAFGPEDSALALSLLDLYATTLGLGVCWGGFVYKTVNLYPPLFKALGLPENHLAYGAAMVGYPKFQYQRIPVRNRPQATWK
jgi:nitroreductase/NAD-dependent dihydropyrimidine dehydrogenase PreA subunit